MALADRTTDFAGTHIATATTTQVKVGVGTLKRIVVGTPVSGGTVTVYDDTDDGTSPVITILTSDAGEVPYDVDYDVHFRVGLKVVTTEAQDVTVVWQ